jgi:hypothetical protein
MTHEHIFYLVDSNGMSTKIIQETHHLHQDTTLTGVLVHERILQTRKRGLQDAYPPFCRLSHGRRLSLPLEVQPLLLACWHGRDKIILRLLDEEGSVHLSKSRINRALPAGLVIHGTKLIVHPPPMCNLAVMHGSKNIEMAMGMVPSGQKTKTNVT